MRIGLLVAGAVMAMAVAAPAAAKDFQVKMLNKGNCRAKVFSPEVVKKALLAVSLGQFGHLVQQRRAAAPGPKKSLQSSIHRGCVTGHGKSCGQTGRRPVGFP